MSPDSERGGREINVRREMLDTHGIVHRVVVTRNMHTERAAAQLIRVRIYIYIQTFELQIENLSYPVPRHSYVNIYRPFFRPN